MRHAVLTPKSGSSTTFNGNADEATPLEMQNKMVALLDIASRTQLGQRKSSRASFEI